MYPATLFVFISEHFSPYGYPANDVPVRHFNAYKGGEQVSEEVPFRLRPGTCQPLYWTPINGNLSSTDFRGITENEDINMVIRKVQITKFKYVSTRAEPTMRIP